MTRQPGPAAQPCCRTETTSRREAVSARELEQIFKSYALSPDESHAALRFLPIDRINTILAVAPNPGAFTEIEKWLAKLDVPAKIPAGSIQNNIYKLKYGRAEIVGAAIGELYGERGHHGPAFAAERDGRDHDIPAVHRVVLGDDTDRA